MPRPRKLILKCGLSPGDIVMLTATVRDLHKAHPGKFLTDVRTGCAELWQGNPYVTPIHESERGVRLIDCKSPLIEKSNRVPYHFIHGFTQHLARQLGLAIPVTEFKGDIHISEEEKSWFSQVHELAGREIPFWIIVSGGKYDYTIKWWDHARYQKVVDHFQGTIQFVQVGDYGHNHPRLNGAIDLRGRTDLRQLVRLVYHSQGVLCPVTSLMHLAAAVPPGPATPRRRPCVVVAGAREPMHWEAYPWHQYIHNCGALPCCHNGGCWRDRAFPLGDGTRHDKPENLCVDTVGQLPRCMDMISAEEVIRRIGTYFEGGIVRGIAPLDRAAAKRAVTRSTSTRYTFDDVLTEFTAEAASQRFIRAIPPYPDRFAGRGIVICGGGLNYFPGVWVLVHQLRALGCGLPIEVWHLGANEWDAQMTALLAPLGVAPIDAEALRRSRPARMLGGWELKCYAVLHSRFREVLLLDADNLPTVDPTFLFDSPEYRSAGAILWPDLRRCNPRKKMWRIFGVPFREGRECDSGQLLIDKKKCWRPLALAQWYNEHSDFYYQHILGDKETFHLAFRKLGARFAMPARPPRHMAKRVMCQHDFEGRRIFQHRNLDKWNLWASQRSFRDFRFEAECLEYLRRLQKVWDGRMGAYKVFPARSRARTSGPRLSAVMISCRRRGKIRERTLASLRASDWGDRPVHVQLDRHLSSHPQVSQLQNTRRALVSALRKPADYILFLEDDLEFNRYFWHNLQTWKPLQHRVVTLASLCRLSGVRPVAADLAAGCWVADPNSMYGSQAFVLSPATVEFMLTNWDLEPGGQDIRLSRLAARLDRPILYHDPSLVQHVGRTSTWGGKFQCSRDYRPDWKRPA